MFHCTFHHDRAQALSHSIVKFIMPESSSCSGNDTGWTNRIWLPPIHLVEEIVVLGPLHRPFSRFAGGIARLRNLRILESEQDNPDTVLIVHQLPVSASTPTSLVHNVSHVDPPSPATSSLRSSCPTPSNISIMPSPPSPSPSNHSFSLLQTPQSPSNYFSSPASPPLMPVPLLPSPTLLPPPPQPLPSTQGQVPFSNVHVHSRKAIKIRHRLKRIKKKAQLRSPVRWNDTL